MTEDQINGWANSIKNAEAEHNAVRKSVQQAVILRATLATHDSEIAHLQVAGMNGV